MKYVEKRPPLTPTIQLTMAAIDSGFLTDFFDAAIFDALTKDGAVEIRDAATFAARAADARTTLYEAAAEQADILETMLEQRDRIIDALEGISGEYDARHDMEMQLAFLFRPGFLQTMDVFGRYPRYLKAMQIRIQRFRNNPQTDARKLAEVEPFQNRLSAKLMESDDIGSAYGLLEFAMLLEEFRVNRFAPEIKTPLKVSSQRLEDVFQSLEG